MNENTGLLRSNIISLLDSFPAHIAVLDPSGRIVLVNEAWRRFGAGNGQRDPACGLGRSYLDICGQAGDDPTAQAVAAGLRAVARGEGSFELDYPCHGPDELHWYKVHARPVELDGQRCVLVAHENITARMQAQIARHESEQRLALALEAGEMGTWELDLRSQRITWNEVQYRLFGLDPASFVPEPEAIMALMPPEDRARVRRQVEAALAGDGPPEIRDEWRIVLPSGEQRWIASIGRLLRDPTGAPRCLSGVAFDVTARKERELRLIADRTAALDVSAAKTQLVASVSHEIRTPLTAVLGFAELLASSALDGPQRQQVDIILTTGRSLLAIVNDVLDYAKLEAGQVAVQRVPFRLDRLVADLRLLAEMLTAEKALRFELDSNPALPRAVLGDPVRLKQVLTNLLSNAAKFTPSGEVRLEIRPCHDGERELVRFAVHDTGIGIAAADQPKLFQAYGRLAGSGQSGSGLGLLIARQLVERMGGRMGLESAPGRGSSFWFELPLARAAEADLEPPAAPVPGAAARALEILVVDDLQTNRLLMSSLLQRMGHRVRLATNGAEAVAAVTAGLPDLVLMDLHMEVMDGLEATRRIRALGGRAAGLPIVALTASSFPSDVEACLGAGMSGHLAKPITGAALSAAVARHAAAGAVPKAG